MHNMCIVIFSTRVDYKIVDLFQWYIETLHMPFIEYCKKIKIHMFMCIDKVSNIFKQESWYASN